MIYENVLEGRCIIDLHFDPKAASPECSVEYSDTSLPEFHALSLVSRKVRDEIQRPFYHKNCFSFRDYAVLAWFLNNVPRASALLAEVELIGNPQGTGLRPYAFRALSSATKLRHLTIYAPDFVLDPGPKQKHRRIDAFVKDCRGLLLAIYASQRRLTSTTRAAVKKIVVVDCEDGCPECGERSG